MIIQTNITFIDIIDEFYNNFFILEIINHISLRTNEIYNKLKIDLRSIEYYI